MEHPHFHWDHRSGKHRITVNSVMPGATRTEFIKDAPQSELDRIAAGSPLGCLEFHYVPKHASGLNMVEIEIGALRSQGLDRRIASPERLASEILGSGARSTAHGGPGGPA
jgi:NAD(P)-dependent dehydrogenase (short-subunit alcohol dehydrogenase family)